jgi:hypothetical protein
MRARRANQSQQAFKAGLKWPGMFLLRWGRRTYALPPISAGPCPRCGADRVSTTFSATVLQVFWIFGIARRSELQWLCPSCQTIGTDNASETKSFVSAHGSPLLWRDRVRLPIFAVAVLLAGWAGTRGFDGAIWVVLAAIVLALTLGARHNLRP